MSPLLYLQLFDFHFLHQTKHNINPKLNNNKHRKSKYRKESESERWRKSEEGTLHTERKPPLQSRLWNYCVKYQNFTITQYFGGDIWTDGKSMII